MDCKGTRNFSFLVFFSISRFSARNRGRETINRFSLYFAHFLWFFKSFAVKNGENLAKIFQKIQTLEISVKNIAFLIKYQIKLIPNEYDKWAHVIFRGKSQSWPIIYIYIRSDLFGNAKGCPSLNYIVL